MIDQDRMTDGKAVASELREGKGGGIPWFVIFDTEGRAKATSDGPKGNVGCPAQPHEIDHFFAVVDATRRHMSDEDRAILEREMRSYGAGLVTSRRGEPGQAAYGEAVTFVKNGEFAAAIEAFGDACAEGLGSEAILTDPAMWPLREDPDRRLELSALLAEHARSNHVRLVDPFEPGQRIRLTGRVVDMQSGAALAGALVQLFHTDAGGEYRPGMDAGGGAGNPRVFGYVRTDADGRFTADTIMPERYPNSTVPRHVHYHVQADGYPTLKSECFFDADPNLTDEARSTAPERNFPIVKLARDAELRLAGTLTVRVPNGG